MNGAGKAFNSGQPSSFHTVPGRGMQFGESLYARNTQMLPEDQAELNKRKMFLEQQRKMKDFNSITSGKIDVDKYAQSMIGLSESFQSAPSRAFIKKPPPANEVREVEIEKHTQPPPFNVAQIPIQDNPKQVPDVPNVPKKSLDEVMMSMCKLDSTQDKKSAFQGNRNKPRDKGVTQTTPSWLLEENFKHLPPVYQDSLRFVCEDSDNGLPNMKLVLTALTDIKVDYSRASSILFITQRSLPNGAMTKQEFVEALALAILSRNGKSFSGPKCLYSLQSPPILETTLTATHNTTPFESCTTTAPLQNNNSSTSHEVDDFGDFQSFPSAEVASAKSIAVETEATGGDKYAALRELDLPKQTSTKHSPMPEPADFGNISSIEKSSDLANGASLFDQLPDFQQNKSSSHLPPENVSEPLDITSASLTKEEEEFGSFSSNLPQPASAINNPDRRQLSHQPPAEDVSQQLSSVEPQQTSFSDMDIWSQEPDSQSQPVIQKPVAQSSASVASSNTLDLLSLMDEPPTPPSKPNQTQILTSPPTLSLDENLSNDFPWSVTDKAATGNDLYLAEGDISSPVTKTKSVDSSAENASVSSLELSGTRVTGTNELPAIPKWAEPADAPSKLETELPVLENDENEFDDFCHSVPVPVSQLPADEDLFSEFQDSANFSQHSSAIGKSQEGKSEAVPETAGKILTLCLASSVGLVQKTIDCFEKAPRDDDTVMEALCTKRGRAFVSAIREVRDFVRRLSQAVSKSLSKERANPEISSLFSEFETLWARLVQVVPQPIGDVLAPGSTGNVNEGPLQPTPAHLSESVCCLCLGRFGVAGTPLSSVEVNNNIFHVVCANFWRNNCVQEESSTIPSLIPPSS